MLDAGTFYLITIIIPVATFFNAVILLPFPRLFKNLLLTSRVRSYAEMFAMMACFLFAFHFYCQYTSDFTDLHLEQDMLKRTSSIAKKYHIERNFHIGLLGFINWMCAWASIHYLTKIRNLENKIKRD